MRRRVGLGPMWVLALTMTACLVSASEAPITEDSVYAKFSGLQTKLLALEAADFFTDLAQGVAAHFGTTGSKATAIPAQIAANFAANSAASMLLTSLNESLSILIPKGDRSVTVETSNKRRLQGWDEGLPQQTAYDDFGQGLTIVYVDSLDDYVYDDGTDDDFDDMMDPWIGGLGFPMGGFGGMPTFPGALTSGNSNDDADDLALAGAFSSFAKEYGVDTLGLLNGSGPLSAAAQLRRPEMAAPLAEHVDNSDEEAVLPQFAVFGPQRGSQNEGNTIIVTDLSTAPPAVPTGQAVDAIVIPLSDAARTQIPHGAHSSSSSSQMDARWWGVIAAVALCTLLCAVIFMSWSKSRGTSPDDAGPGPQPQDPLLSGANPASDAYLQAVRTKESKINIVPGQAARKVSNLPA